MMKRFITLILILAMSFGLMSCDSREQVEKTLNNKIADFIKIYSNETEKTEKRITTAFFEDYDDVSFDELSALTEIDTEYVLAHEELKKYEEFSTDVVINVYGNPWDRSVIKKIDYVILGDIHTECIRILSDYVFCLVYRINNEHDEFYYCLEYEIIHYDEKTSCNVSGRGVRINSVEELEAHIEARREYWDNEK